MFNEEPKGLLKEEAYENIYRHLYRCLGELEKYGDEVTSRYQGYNYPSMNMQVAYINFFGANWVLARRKEEMVLARLGVIGSFFGRYYVESLFSKSFDDNNILLKCKNGVFQNKLNWEGLNQLKEKIDLHLSPTRMRVISV